MLSLRAFATALLLTLAATTAEAATYWVSPTGTSGASGADSLANATTLAWFNANAAAGDVCRFRSGTYAAPVMPAHNGTAGGRIRYYGFPQDPTAVVVSNIEFGYRYGSYCTARWLSSTTGASGIYEAGGMEATDDSVVACRISGLTGPFTIGSMRSVVDSLVLSGTLTGSGQNHFVSISGERDHYNGSIGEWTIGSLNNQFKNSILNCEINTTTAPGDCHVILVSAAAYNVIANNTINVTVTNCAGYFFAIEQYEGYSNQFVNNAFSIAANGPITGTHGIWSHRDSSSYNRYTGNTVNVTGGGTSLSFMLTNSGSFPGTTGHNYFGNNLFNVHSPQSGTGVLWWYDGFRQDTLEYNTVMTDSNLPLVSVPNNLSFDGAVFRHNTYWTNGPTAVQAPSAVAANSPRLTSEVFYCRTASAPGSEIVRLPSGAHLDSAGVFFSPASSTPNSAIAYAGADGAPGSGGSYGLPGMSVWGSPRFADSTYTSFNGRLGSASAALSPSFTDGFAGAYAAAGSDVTAPANVTDLAGGQPTLTSLLLSWTAPGDDGTTGTATLYDLRWSTSPITAANFGAAMPVSPQPVPLVAGTAQLYTALNLSQATTYYFALRTRDDAGNWSGVSNVASATTLGGDTTPPAAITDLSAGP